MTKQITVNGKTMTPKEKCDELIEKFKPYVDYMEDSTNRIVTNAMELNAKECALICVNEIIEAGAGDVIVGEGEDADLVSGFTFYSAVKSELEKS